MNRFQLMAASLVAAVPAGYLAYLLVNVLFTSPPAGPMMGLVGGALAFSALPILLPVAALVVPGLLGVKFDQPATAAAVEHSGLTAEDDVVHDDLDEDIGGDELDGDEFAADEADSGMEENFDSTAEGDYDQSLASVDEIGEFEAEEFATSEFEVTADDEDES